MKRKIILGLILLTAQTDLTAQVHDHAIGSRVTASSGRFNPSFSYQLGLGQHSRLDFGLSLSGGWRQSNTHFIFGKSSLYYQRVWNIAGGLNWFAGAGVQHSFSYSRFQNINTMSHYVGVGPQIGLEYDFNNRNVPLIVGIDYRPTVGIGTFTDHPSLSHNFGLSLRYTFDSKKK